ncbi:unnamed protein product [Mytilus coruscus]|uniref:Uncharacterized protein n=1 Tax=Mytilus coruscus TaxID=42192 RepID=A0A6J8ACU0_MYTCO|nr:unnamed protein product [Mytilus coruscus]
MIALATIICVAVIGFCSKGNRIWMCKRQREGHSNQRMQAQSHQLVQQNRSAEYIDVIDENAYESIEDVSTDDAAISGDASNIDGNSISVNNDQNSTSTNSNESVRVIDDDYLTPYEPLNEHIEKHHYKKIKPKVDIVFGKEDTSSDSDKNSMDSSGYLKPVRIEESVI